MGRKALLLKRGVCIHAMQCVAGRDLLKGGPSMYLQHCFALEISDCG